MAEYYIQNVAHYPVRRRFLRLFRHSTAQERGAARAAWYRYWRQPSPHITCEVPKFHELPKHFDALAREFYRVFCEGVARFVLHTYREKVLSLADMSLYFESPDKQRYVALDLHKDGGVEVRDSEGEGPFPFAYPTSLAILMFYTYPALQADPQREDTEEEQDDVFGSPDEPFGGDEFIDPFLDYLEREGERRIRYRCTASAGDGQHNGNARIEFKTQFQRLP